MGSQFGEVFDEFGIQDHAVAGDLTPVLARLSDELAHGSTPFASARAFDFTTSTGEIREWLALCAGVIAERYPEYPGLYTEMNGFDINTDRWFASLDPLETAPTLDPETWDAMDVVPFPPVLELAGAEAMQDAFHQWWSMPKSPTVDREVALAQWLVWAKWLVLFQAAWLEGPVPLVRVPIVATAHDFDVALLLAAHPHAT